MTDTARCSFCERDHGAVECIVVGDTASICDECVAIATGEVARYRLRQALLRKPRPELTAFGAPA